MTADHALPAWVVDRVKNATNEAAPDFEMFAGECMIEAGLAAFLAIIEERGLRIVPVVETDDMIDRALNHPAAFYDDHRCQAGEPGHGWPGTLYREMLVSAPSLAELLEKPDAD